MAVRFFSTKYQSTGEGGNIEVKQATKMNVVAPHTTTIDIPYTSRFNKLPVEVLKMHGEQKNIVDTLADFDNSDASDFESNKYVIFDGVMRLKVDYEEGTILEDDEVYIYNFADLFGEFSKIEEEIVRASCRERV